MAKPTNTRNASARQHTPGPWRWEGGTLEQVTPDNNGDIILGLYDEFCTQIDNPADEALIAAAPDLLEALKEVVRWHSANMPRGLDEKVAAAIAKAEGR
jgi:hypothetical protein